MAAAAAGALSPVAFAKWIEEIKPTLAPPVGNRLLYGAGQQKVMVVGGPNQREDFHIEVGEVSQRGSAHRRAVEGKQ